MQQVYCYPFFEQITPLTRIFDLDNRIHALGPARTMNIPRVLTSSKFQAAAFATALIAVPLIFTLTDKSVSRPEKQAATEKFIIATAGLWGIAVGGTAIEDYAKYRDAPTTATPAAQVNVGSDVRNTQAPVIATTSQTPSPGTFTPIIDPAARTSSPAPPPKQP